MRYKRAKGKLEDEKFKKLETEQKVKKERKEPKEEGKDNQNCQRTKCKIKNVQEILVSVAYLRITL